MLIWILLGCLSLMAGIVIAVVLYVTKKKKTEEFHTLQEEIAQTQELEKREELNWDSLEKFRQIQKNIRNLDEDDEKTRNLFADSDIGLFSFLVELQDIKTGEKFTTGIAESIKVGRKPDCNLVFNRATVSGFHCEIRMQDGVLVLTDQQSTNGTFVNGIRVEGSIRLTSGVILRLGQEEFLVTVSDFRKNEEEDG